MGAQQQPTNVLFLCTGNSIRSQMAESVARARFGDQVEVRSAGVLDAGLDSTARELLIEGGHKCDGLYSKVVTPDLLQWADVVVDMTALGRHMGEHAGKAFALLHCPVYDPVAYSDQAINEEVRRAYSRTLTEVEELVDGLRMNFDERP